MAGKTEYRLALWDMEVGSKRWEIPAADGDLSGLNHSLIRIVDVSPKSVLIVQSVDKDAALRGYSTTDGSLLWTSSLKLDETSPLFVLSPNGQSLAVRSVEAGMYGGKPYLAVLDTSAGTILAKRDLEAGGVPNNVVWAGPTTILGVSNGIINAFAVDRGLQPPGTGVYPQFESQMLNETGSVLYLITRGSPYILSAVDVATGVEKWQLKLERQLSLVAARSGKLIVNTRDAVTSIGSNTNEQIVVLDGATGAQLKVLPGALVEDNITFGGGGQFLSVIGGSTRRITAWRVSTATPLGVASVDSDKDVPPLLLLTG